jgi:hypothetical protein
MADEDHWLFVFSRKENFSYESFSRKPDIEQNIYNSDLMNEFEEINFTPKGCVNFETAVVYKFEKNLKDGPRTYITLGEI